MEEFIREQLGLVLTEQRAMREDFTQFQIGNEHRLTKVEESASRSAKRSGALWGAITSVVTAIGLLVLALVKGVI